MKTMSITIGARRKRHYACIVAGFVIGLAFAGVDPRSAVPSVP